MLEVATIRTVFFGILGLALGVLLASATDFESFGAAVLAAALGLLFGRIGTVARAQHALKSELQALRTELAALRTRAAPEPIAEAAPESEPLPEPEPVAAPELVIAAATEIEPEPEAATQAPVWTPPPPRAPGPVDLAFAAARRWLFGGNTVARLGILLLFLGLAFLLRYAAEHASLPIELRYAGVGVVSLILLAIGWRLRERRRTYGLMLQGGAVAVMYLTILAAMHLNPLIPLGLGFFLLVAIVLFSTILAVTQDALGLAVAGAAGGFAAPILTSAGGEHHVALFAYLALLNAGILAVAWFKAWRPLNLVGFAGTFILGFAWGLETYEPAMFASTEPFLVLFFLMYVAIALLFARRVLLDAPDEPESETRLDLVRWTARRSNYLDGLLLFGAPIVGFGLQDALVRHIPLGDAFSALALGLFYMALAALLLRQTGRRQLGLVEIYMALGAIFATLAIPLGLDARWTAAAWAVEGAGLYWIALRQRRRVARGFAVLVELGAALAYLDTVRIGGERLLAASPLGALMLGLALLSGWWLLRQVPAGERHREDAIFRRFFLFGGTGFLAFIAPLFFASDGTAALWAGGGLGAVILGLRLRDRGLRLAGLILQAAAGLVFALALPTAGRGIGEAVLGDGLRGLIVAALIGGAAIASAALALRDGWSRADARMMRGQALLLLFGLGFLNFAVLFVLPWRMASGIWAMSGLLILILGLQLNMRASFGFGLALQVIGGAAFLFGAGPMLASLSPDGLTPLWHSGFWTPAALGLAAYAAACRLHRQRAIQWQAQPPPLGFAALSTIALIWATLWWAIAWLGEIARFLPGQARPHAALLVAAVTVAIWLVAARRWQWPALARLCVLLQPAAMLALAAAYDPLYHPAAHLGALAWAVWFAAHLLVLRRIGPFVPARWLEGLHIVGCWVTLAVLALEMRYLFILLSDQVNAWRWLGWASIPALYLLLAAQRRFPAIWPISAYERAYRSVAALPVALLMLAWFWLGNTFSDGTADPLPYLPLINPLELGQMLVLFSLALWLRERFPALPLAARVPAALPAWLLGASGLFLLTCAVFRTAHHWIGIPWALDALLASMPVQASLSILWAVTALAMMVAGNRRAQRSLWLVGAGLIAVVVVKLFLVELLNTGGLPRIISFVGVGVLLLIVGYFAPLPPKPGTAGAAS